MLLDGGVTTCAGAPGAATAPTCPGMALSFPREKAAISQCSTSRGRARGGGTEVRPVLPGPVPRLPQGGEGLRLRRCALGLAAERTGERAGGGHGDQRRVSAGSATLGCAEPSGLSCRQQLHRPRVPRQPRAPRCAGQGGPIPVSEPRGCPGWGWAQLRFPDPQRANEAQPPATAAWPPSPLQHGDHGRGSRACEQQLLWL